jgi:MFS family permease
MTKSSTVSMPLVTSATRTRLLTTLFTAVSIFNASQIVSFTLLSIVAMQLTHNESLSGIPATIVLLGRALIAYPIGWLMDKLGRRLGIGLGFLMSVFGAGLAAFAVIWGSLWWFCIGGLLNGMGRGASEQSRYAAADIERPERAASAISLIVWAGTIGAIFGPWLIAPSKYWAASLGVVDLAGPYFFTAFCAFIAFLIVIFLLRPDPKQISQHAAAQQQTYLPSSHSAQRTIGQALADADIRLAVITLVVSQLVMTLIMVVNPLHMHHLHHSDTDISFVTMAHTLGMFALSSVTGWLVQRVGKLKVILLGAFVLMTSAVLTPLAQGVWMLGLALFLLGYGWNLGYVAGSSLLAESLRPGERARIQGFSETFVALAATLGSYSTGPTFSWGGIVAVCAVGLTIGLGQMLAGFLTKNLGVRSHSYSKGGN